MESRNIIIVTTVLLLFGAYVAGKGYQPIPDEQYTVLIKLLQNDFKVPVKERTNVHKAAIIKFWRNNYRLGQDGKTILLDDQVVVRTSEVSKLVKDEMHRTKGSGSRKLYKRLASKVTGLSEKRVKEVTEKSRIYSHLNAKFPNKARLRPIYAKQVHDIHQIDLIELRNLHARSDGKYYRYALSVLDVFSRFIWLVALEKKLSKTIARALKSIYLVHGTPKILQSDNGAEFQGAVAKLMRSLNVKITRSSPYHPQSQGKVERCHRSLRKKILYDLLKHCRTGKNWVTELPVYNKLLNEEPKEELGWKSPFEVYYGRKSNCVLLSGCSVYCKEFVPSGELRQPKARHRKTFFKSQIAKRKAADIATRRINQRTIEREERANPPTEYNVNDKVLVKLTKTKSARLANAKIVQAFVEKTNRRLARYKVSFTNQDGQAETKWVPVNNITSCTLSQERRKHKKSIGNLRRKKSKYLIQLTCEDKLAQILNQGFHLVYDPEGDGSCQFAALADQLTSLGVYRSPATLREEVVQDIRNRPYTCDGDDISLFVEDNDLQAYLTSMEQLNTYGDHVTLLRMSEIFNCRILVVSSQGADHVQVIGKSGPLLTVGYLPEGHGEHYLSLKPKTCLNSKTFLQNAEEEQCGHLDHGRLEQIDLLRPMDECNDDRDGDAKEQICFESGVRDDSVVRTEAKRSFCSRSMTYEDESGSGSVVELSDYGSETDLNVGKCVRNRFTTRDNRYLKN